MPAATLAAAAGGSAGLHTPGAMVRHLFAAMGTEVTVPLPARAAAEAAGVERLFARWHATCTRFDPQSELSRLNRAAGRSVVVSALLFEVVSSARQAAQATDGLFDPTLLRSLEALGYDRDFADLVDGSARPVPDAPPPATGSWRTMELDRDRRAVRLPAGAGLDLGGLAKGMAVDAGLAWLADRGVTSAAIDAGGDLGVLGLPPEEDAWSIAIEAPLGTRVVSLPFGALATSSASRRRWRQGGAVRHHLLDPRTGLPSEAALWSATVAAMTCARAEVATKAAYLLGPEAGGRFLDERGLAGLFLLPDGQERRVGRWSGR